MASTNLVLGLTPQIDEKKNPDIYAELLSVHNAIRALQSYLDGYTAARIVGTATASITKGSAINFFSSGGIICMRPANATNGTKPCHGFAIENIAAGSSGEAQTIGINEFISGLLPGTVYYLSTVDGLITSVPPGAAGNLIQEIGLAFGVNSLLYRPAFNWKQL